MRPPKARRIVIAAYEGVSLLDLAGPLEAFQVASGFGGSRESRVTYECSVVSIRGGALKTANGVELVSESVTDLPRVDGCAPCVLAASFWPPLAFSTGGERLRTGCTRRCWRSAIPG